LAGKKSVADANAADANAAVEAIREIADVKIRINFEDREGGLVWTSVISLRS